MFLSKTYHMIEKCDSEIASWSENGDNFVVKNVEKFATVSPFLCFYDLCHCLSFFLTTPCLLSTASFATVFQAFQLFQFCPTAQFLRIPQVAD